MQQLIKTVLEENCDIGFAFDGDGDRLGVIDNKGNILSVIQIKNDNIIFSKDFEYFEDTFHP